MRVSSKRKEVQCSRFDSIELRFSVTMKARKLAGQDDSLATSPKSMNQSAALNQCVDFLCLCCGSSESFLEKNIEEIYDLWGEK